MSSLRVRDLGDTTHSGPEDYEHVRVRGHPKDGLANSLQGRYRLYAGRYLYGISRGDIHNIFPQIVYESKC